MQSPTPDQVRDLRERYGLSQSLLAELVHVATRTVQGWEAPATSREHRDMPPGLYELALIKVGESPLAHGYRATISPEPVPIAPMGLAARRRRARRARELPVEPPPAPPPPKPVRPSPERLAALRALAERSLGLKSTI